MSLGPHEDTIMFSKALPNPHQPILDLFMQPYIEIMNSKQAVAAPEGSFKDLLSEKVKPITTTEQMEESKEGLSDETEHNAKEIVKVLK